MYHEDETELTLDERNALASLSREMPVSDILEARVVRALRSEGHLGESTSGKARRIPLSLRIAAAIALFAGGVATGRYILASEAPQRADVNAPSSQVRDIPTSQPPAGTNASQRETIVAEREVWF